MSVVAKAYAHICEALDKQPTLQKFLADQAIEWGKINVRRLDKHRSSTEETLLNFAVLPLPSRSLSIPEKAMVLVAIYNARCAGRDPINPWHDKPPKSRMQKRVQTLIRAQSYDQDDDEFGLTMDDIPTIRRYVDDLVSEQSNAEGKPQANRQQAQAGVGGQQERRERANLDALQDLANHHYRKLWPVRSAAEWGRILANKIPSREKPIDPRTVKKLDAWKRAESRWKRTGQMRGRLQQHGISEALLEQLSDADSRNFQQTIDDKIDAETKVQLNHDKELQRLIEEQYKDSDSQYVERDYGTT